MIVVADAVPDAAVTTAQLLDAAVGAARSLETFLVVLGVDGRGSEEFPVTI